MWPHCFLPDDKQGDLDGKKADGKAERRAGGGPKESVIPGQPAKEHSQVFRTITGQTGGSIFSAEVPSSQMILACVKLTQR